MSTTAMYRQGYESAKRNYKVRAQNQNRVRTAGRGLLKETKNIKTQVKNIQRKIKAGEATHTRRFAYTAQVGAGGNSSKIAFFPGVDVTQVESAMNALRYLDPATNAIVTSDQSTGTYNRQTQIEKVSTSIECRNNYQSDAKVTIYACTPKADTSISPTSAVFLGIADQGNVSQTSINLFPTDSEQFRKLWKIEKSWSKELKPGQTLRGSLGRKPFGYDVSNVDSHNLAYQKAYGAVAWMVRIQGTLAHEPTGTAMEFLNKAEVDVLYRTTIRVRYDAGVNLEDYSTTENLQTWNVNGVQSQKPVSDNIPYSIA